MSTLGTPRCLYKTDKHSNAIKGGSKRSGSIFDLATMLIALFLLSLSWNSFPTPLCVTFAPPNMDDTAERRRFLAESLDTDDDASQDGSTTNSTHTSEMRKRPAQKGRISKLRANARQNQSQNSNTNAGGNAPAASNPGPILGVGTNQMMGGSVNKPHGGIQIEGTNIGSRASEPTRASRTRRGSTW
ncbi:hypothetical protein LTR35_017757 [Friedmanniomyces endolithicus]|uniref:Uncharacterized protein n=1 Tax=Friedmanniomyces endolithicus TaxID=329885 RepID=A0AAN6F577_9PEZI|nr:hypothetical protein LTR35_017757 [Friedmanniomyces endolithicus]KAK0267597.1 hypothetical protein LTS00_017763 [Friedmanniomyces endolithicus]KAK0302795.1 hypothetical protein LTR82_017759 [Friedmanniomyces endolithicus]KAK0971371.1 hypothetical protein LTR54_017805 [Friedmanniomyces endolithicus]